MSLQRRGWRASARRFDTDARGIAEVGNRSDSALGPNVAGTGTLQRLSYLFNLSNEELYVMMHEQSDEAHVTDGDGGGFYDDAEADDSISERL